MYHPAQLYLPEFSAWRLMDNLDVFPIAHATRVVKKDGSPIEDEPTEVEASARMEF